jgi:hypothetical protein
MVSLMNDQWKQAALNSLRARPGEHGSEARRAIADAGAEPQQFGLKICRNATKPRETIGLGGDIPSLTVMDNIRH